MASPAAYDPTAEHSRYGNALVGLAAAVRAVVSGNLYPPPSWRKFYSDQKGQWHKAALRAAEVVQ